MLGFACLSNLNSKSNAFYRVTEFRSLIWDLNLIPREKALNIRTWNEWDPTKSQVPLSTQSRAQNVPQVSSWHRLATSRLHLEQAASRQPVRAANRESFWSSGAKLADLPQVCNHASPHLNSGEEEDAVNCAWQKLLALVSFSILFSNCQLALAQARRWRQSWKLLVSWNESLGGGAVRSEEQAATCLVRHRHLLTGLYTLLQLLLCVNTSYTETYTHTTR